LKKKKMRIKRVTTITYLLNDQLKHNLRSRPQIINLQVLGLVQTVLWREGAKQAIGPFVQRHGAIGMRVCERRGRVVWGLQVGEAITQHVGEARGLLALAVCRVGARVFCFFGEEVQEDFVVGEECRLRGFDLKFEFEFEFEF
jgi:hypothetical protein